MNRKDIDRRKKFILELMGDPVYKPMRLLRAVFPY